MTNGMQRCTKEDDYVLLPDIVGHPVLTVIAIGKCREFLIASWLLVPNKC